MHPRDTLIRDAMAAQQLSIILKLTGIGSR
jgi:hypothetical protein